MPLFVQPVRVESAGFTPTLTGIVVGTGGSPTNSAFYTFVGPTGVGAKGSLTVQGTIKFGTSGQTFPTAPRIALPSGFQFDDAPGGTDTVQPVGIVLFEDASPAAYVYGTLGYASATTIALAANTANTTYVTASGISTSIPFTWASNDLIIYQYTIRAERV